VSTTALYAVSFVGALLTSLILVPIVRAVALRRTILDTPTGHKSHETPVPYLGGVAMVIAFSLAVVAGALLRQDTSFGDGSVLLAPEGIFTPGLNTFTELFVVLALALTLSAMGLVDDLRGLHPFLRLSVEVVVAAALIGLGVQFTSPLPDGIDVVITLVWIVGITNALNLLDNIDGLAAGVTSIAGLAIFVIGLRNDQPLIALLAIGLAGCTLGFLRSNFHPASIYMGDAGSLYLGFMLAYLTLKIRVDPAVTTQLFVPLVLMGIAVLDTTLVVVSRVHRGISPFDGGQDHISHRFLRLGVSVRRGVTVILMGASVLAVLAVALMQMPSGAGWMVLGAVVVHGVAVTVLLTTKVARESREQIVDDRITPLRRRVV